MDLRVSGGYCHGDAFLCSSDEACDFCCIHPLCSACLWRQPPSASFCRHCGPSKPDMLFDLSIQEHLLEKLLESASMKVDRQRRRFLPLVQAQTCAGIVVLSIALGA